MKKLDFSEGAQVRKLELGIDMSRVLVGEVSDQFVPAEPFTFEAAE